MKDLKKHTDVWSAGIIALTLVLFLTALFLRGLSHDLLLEAGVFLVSVKLILLSYKSSVVAVETSTSLTEIMDSLRRVEAGTDRKSDATEA